VLPRLPAVEHDQTDARSGHEDQYLKRWVMDPIQYCRLPCKEPTTKKTVGKGLHFHNFVLFFSPQWQLFSTNRMAIK
jgi:hypothetical protein